MRFCVFVAFLMVFSCAGAVLGENDRFVTISGASYRVTDGRTGIPVTVTVGSFSIAKTEVTQKEFADIMGYNPSYHRGPDFPVETVSWWEAVRYCNLRSVREGLAPCYDLSTGECNLAQNGYRLPTDAEWSLADSTETVYTPETVHRYGNIGSSNTKNIPELMQALQKNTTQKPGSFLPNAPGLYDMTGNVWEWCSDFDNPVDNVPIPLHNPQGPSRGTERILRGGSFMSMVNSWSRGFRSSMKPEHKSRFTGFRVCRSIAGKAAAPEFDEISWFESYNRAPEGFAGSLGNLVSLVKDGKGGTIQSVPQWQEKKKPIRARWEKLLGTIDETPPEPSVIPIETFEEEEYTGRLMYLQVESGFREKIYVMIPRKPLVTPTPVVITPYYDVDAPAGKNMGGRSYSPPGVRSFAYLMIQQGCIAVAVRWFGESYGEQYGEAVAELKLRHPGLSGLGKWVWDAGRVIDYIYTMPEADHARIGIIGHSLGGKMALYAAAMDERITAVVASEPGIGLTFTNYDDFWYFGDYIRNIDPSTDQHELLGLIAPRPFLLIGGDDSDTDKSWYYINAAREVYGIYGKPGNIGYYNHRTGHSPTPEAVRLSIEWLNRFLAPDMNR
ncbi:SUMF1/EgtB/PvdO family nonheme iron enzyme [bacterium]|nr:SUMF1/EgtB/PvdO family nonheme iron enzyme [bacterium]